ncbi:hypothetical protein P154DRAFT_126658 [Amniculicola lignicola CBS 123094]|uniref:Uncharacterized protein n=1 Tax=Amniculicola lignicola CBS 123094 TaxID=1392246 RepID=A0A6A5WQ80_9PLEO|nr:hypothetical protein P154DRAFT_126658 [Amniculicola lignicola CBS 123094]
MSRLNSKNEPCCDCYVYHSTLPSHSALSESGVTENFGDTESLGWGAVELNGWWRRLNLRRGMRMIHLRVGWKEGTVW